ncbi:allophanate hydrolase [Sneathiella sp. HT1-7]|uniref:allophanate hydrolase n=1 Tax=Sneathiella sp. HT1-7 TaxID=2887192 RepID=UPI001D13A5AB|nr:allophanate hydrolase [Sneathiella sp. HT1-7]MCC3303845.1 allophanate hydrolase [Sneathiella sp. HT1-7]
MNSIPFTISALHDSYRNGMKATEIVEQAFSRIQAVNDPGIFIHMLDREEVLAAARELGEFDDSRPLWGIPYVIKDNIDAGGKPTTAACPAYSYVAKEDAFVVKCLKEAGALLLGKVNLDQFATGLVGVRSPYSPPKNAIDPEIVPGGSSSGSAVSVAHGFACFSLGTDTAGSGRVPAALNNIVGLKPTLGALSASGVVPACRTLDTISVFALTVGDAYKVFEVACKFDAADSYSRKITAKPLSAIPPRFKVGIPDSKSIKFFGDKVQEVSFRKGLEELTKLGAEIIEIDFTPFYNVAQMLYEGAWVAERYTTIEELLSSNPDAIHPVTRDIISVAEKFSSADVFRGMYKLEHLKRLAEPILATLDYLCVPTIPTFYKVEDLEKDPVTPNSNFGTYTNFVNLLDMCALSFPTGPRSDGRPGSLTLLAPAGQDAEIAVIGQEIQSRTQPKLGATDWIIPSSTKQSAASLSGNEIEIVVCGAHMSGLPLNKELTSRGGRFIRTASTTNDYQFFALAGGPPDRPGLVRTDPGMGFEIDLEVWALPKENMGLFMENIPFPLAIGTISLSDGSRVKGFVCEAAGTHGATDISSLKTWRRYVA